jgi:lysophospholipase L1-like esterase
MGTLSRASAMLALHAGLLAGGCGADAKPSRYLALGDSYTCGESVGPGDGYPQRLAARLARDGVDLGAPTVVAVTGWTTGDLLAALDRDPPRGSFELVTLLIGVNNQFQGRGEGDYRREFAALVARAVALAGGRPSHVVVLSIPDWGVTPFAAGRDRVAIGRAIDRFNDINRAESKRAGVRYVDVTAESRGAATRPALVAGDGLHPSAAMYAEWVDAAVPTVEAAVRP